MTESMDLYEYEKFTRKTSQHNEEVQDKAIRPTPKRQPFTKKIIYCGTITIVSCAIIGEEDCATSVILELLDSDLYNNFVLGQRTKS